MHKFPFEKKNISGNNTAIITEENKKVTYDELLLRVSKLSKLILRGTTCLIKSSNNFDALLIYLACMQKKATVILIDNNTKENSFNNIVNKFKPNYIYLNKKNIKNNKYKKLQGNFFNNLYMEKEIIKKRINKEVALLLSTSGSTGAVKFVKLSYENIKSNTINIIDYIKITNSDCTITNLPIFYSYGLSVINTHIFAGAKLILTEKPLIDKATLKLVKENPISNFNGVPFTYDIIFKFKLEEYYLFKLSFVTQAGGKIKEKSFKKLAKNSFNTKTKFFIMYGQTEASPRMSYYLVKKKKFISGIIGKPIKEGKFFLFDNKNKIISKPNKIGKLFYRGPNVCLGYAESYIDLMKNLSSKRSLDTGDIAKFNVRKDFILISRNSRYVKIEDKRINLDDIEQKIQQKGIEVICTGGDKINIWYNNRNIDLNKIYKIIKENFSFTKRAISFRFINDFPKNSSGKIIYKDLHL